MTMRGVLRQVREAGEQLASAGSLAAPVFGLEAVIAGGFHGLESGDWVVPGPRERVGAVLRGCSVERLERAGDGARPYRIAPVTPDPAARMLHACGLSLALGPETAVLCFVGQGAASYGAFHEAMNMAHLHQLHVIFLCHAWDLDHAESPLSRQLGGSMQALALAHGMRPHSVNGAVLSDVLSAVTEARAHSGPSFIEARLTRGQDPLTQGDDEPFDLAGNQAAGA